MKMQLRLTTLLLAACAAGGAHAQAAMSKDALKAQKVAIEARYDLAQARCKSQKDNARDVCEQMARGERDIAAAELEFRAKPTPKNDEQLRVVRAEAAHALAREKCDPLEGNARDVCRKEAKAVFAQAKAEAKLQSQVAGEQLRSEQAVQERNEAEQKRNDQLFAAAQERCHLLQAEAREDCMINARKRFGRL